MWEKLSTEYAIDTVYTNRDYEPYAKDRDREVAAFLAKKSIQFKDFKDHVVFNREEVLKDDGTPYTVFTPYSKKWMAKLDSKGIGTNSYYIKSYPSEQYSGQFLKSDKKEIPSLKEIGFELNTIDFPTTQVKSTTIRQYKEQRDFPAMDGTSKLGVHYRFGTISVREKLRNALDLSKTYVNELIWRDFYATILDHYPHVVHNSFRAKYDAIQWRYDQLEFDKWCAGKTGYPLVDAGMRELNATGYMHNRVRMVVASFLTKHLLMDWRFGEAYFAQKLLDYDLASNNGGWQWAAGSGTDAAPYFRIFNPTSQMERFDKNLVYVKKWVPEYGTENYPAPIVDHKTARERCLKTYKEALT